MTADNIWMGWQLLTRDPMRLALSTLPVSPVAGARDVQLWEPNRLASRVGMVWLLIENLGRGSKWRW